MTRLIFCYHCRISHPADQMRQVPTATGLRWRCLRTIAGASAPIAERDAFGRLQSEANRAMSQLDARRRAGAERLAR